MSLTHWVGRGTGTPKDKDEVNNREVSECESLFSLNRYLPGLFIMNKWEFIIRVKQELKRVYRNGCRYNERLNAETGGSYYE